MKTYMIAIFTLLTVLGAGVTSQAESQVEEPLQTAEEVEALMDHFGLFDKGLAYSEELEFQEQRRNDWRRRPPYRRPPVYRRPPHRRPPHRLPPVRRAPPRSRVTICYAENYRGQLFSYRAYSPWVAQQGAMDQCYRYSRRCFQRGCYAY